MCSKKRGLDLHAGKTDRLTIYCFTMYFIVGFAGIYSLFCILTRYIFPIVPLHLLTIGLFLQNMTKKFGIWSEDSSFKNL